MEIDKDNLHHAYLLIGAWDEETTVSDILKMVGVEKDNNSDLLIHRGPLGIDEARSITSRIGAKPFGDKRVVILDAGEITMQAQNSLLKSLEEPGAGNHFFLVAPYEDLILPTLRSRMQKMQANRDNYESRRSPSDFDGLSAKNFSCSPESFIGLSLTKRIDFAKKFKESEKPVGPFLDSLLAHLHNEKVPTDLIKKVFTMRRYADDQSRDARLILEHLALVLE